MQFFVAILSTLWKVFYFIQGKGKGLANNNSLLDKKEFSIQYAVKKASPELKKHIKKGRVVLICIGLS